jgi:hypothetical protein
MHGWHDVPKLVSEFVKKGSTIFARLQAAMKNLPSPQPGYGHVWLNPRTQAVYFTLGDSDERKMYDDWKKGLKVKGVVSVDGEAETTPSKESGPWLRIKAASLPDIFGPLAQAGGWKGAPTTWLGGPTPLSAMIASGALGAGAGYGAGWLAEHVLPEKYLQRGRLRKNLAMMGGLFGAAPGFWAGTDNLRHGASLMDPFGSTGPGWDKDARDLRHLNNMLDVFVCPDDLTYHEMNKLAEAIEGAGGSSVYVKAIEKDRFNRALWNDPFTPDYLKGMASGIVEGASEIANSPVVSPMDVGRLAVGMGSGLASGLLVGKVLAGLAGISPEAQEGLQRAGIWSGAIRATVPMLYR